MTASQIRQLRNRLGWSMRQMAEYMQVSIPAVSQWETGSSTPDTWREQVLAELKRQVDDMDRSRRAEFAESLAQAALTAGLIGFLAYLLTRTEESEAA